LWATLRQDPTAPAISSVCTVGPTPSIHVTPREESSPRWTSQIRPYVDRPNPAIGRAPKFGESVLPHHHLPLQIGGRGCEACGRRQGGIAGARESPGVGVIPGYGVTRDRRSWRSLGRSPISGEPDHGSLRSPWRRVRQLRGPQVSTCAWWSRRSRKAATAAVSPRSLPQSSTGRLDVSSVDARS